MKNHTTTTELFTPAHIAQLFGTENNVYPTPRPLTNDMTPLQREAWLILWERWEDAAIALFNLRNREADRVTERQIDALLRKFPNVDALIPSWLFEPDFEADEFVEWH